MISLFLVQFIQNHLKTCMANKINHTYKRYILDTLYGVIYLPDYIWEVLFIPEMQRLRELRLYNINSLCFTGGANINRYEHSIGTCYLALQCIESNLLNIPQKEKQLIVLAALFHDLYNAAFGHSLEYVEGYSPENLFSFAATGKKYKKFEYKKASFEQIYFGMCEEMAIKLTERLRLTDEDIEKIGEYICGVGEYGVLISGTLDLDNIDNVYRHSYHLGLVKNTQTPLQLAKAMWAKKGKLYIKEEALPLVEEWMNLRERLYKFLLLNPDEFSAKYMLTEAIELSKVDGKPPFTWYNTDFQILEKLSKSSSNVSNIITRLMKGSLYGCLGIYSTSNTHIYKELSNITQRCEIEGKLNRIFKPEVIMKLRNFSKDDQKIIKAIKGISYDKQTNSLKLTSGVKAKTLKLLVDNELIRHKNVIETMNVELRNKLSSFKLKSLILGIHSILDVNRTKRKVVLNLSSGASIKLGNSSNCLYIGIFIKNEDFANFNPSNSKSLSTYTMLNIKKEIRNFLINYSNDKNMSEIQLYSEAQYAQ